MTAMHSFSRVESVLRQASRKPEDVGQALNWTEWDKVLKKSLLAWMKNVHVLDDDDRESPSEALILKVYNIAIRCRDEDAPAPRSITATVDGTIVWKWRFLHNGEQGFVKAEFTTDDVQFSASLNCEPFNLADHPEGVMVI